MELGRGGAPEGRNHGEGVLYWRVVPVCWGSRRQGDPKGSCLLGKGPPRTLPDSGERCEPNGDGVKKERCL